MRDRTRSGNYSASRDEFRRDHERRRAWGLQRRHADRLRHVREQQAGCWPAELRVAGIDDTPGITDPPSPSTARPSDLARQPAPNCTPRNPQTGREPKPEPAKQPEPEPAKRLDAEPANGPSPSLPSGPDLRSSPARRDRAARRPSLVRYDRIVAAVQRPPDPASRYPSSTGRRPQAGAQSATGAGRCTRRAQPARCVARPPTHPGLPDPATQRNHRAVAPEHPPHGEHPSPATHPAASNHNPSRNRNPRQDWGPGCPRTA